MVALMTLAIYLLPFFVFRPRDAFQPEFFLNLYLLALIGAGPLVLLVFSKDLYQSARYDQVLLLVVAGYASINFGYFLHRIRLRSSYRKLNARWNKQRVASWFARNSKAMRSLALLLVIFGVLSSVLFFVRAGSIPLLAANKEVARVEALSVGGNGYFLYFMTAGMYGIILFAMLHYSGLKQSTFRKLIFIVAFAFVGGLLLGTGSRRYLLWLMLYVAIVRHYYERPIKIKLVLIAGGVGLLLVNLFEMFRNPDSMTTTDLGTTFFFRFVLYVSNLEKVFSAFFEHNQLMYGSTFFMDLSTILPGKQVDFQSWLKDLVGLDFEGFGLPPTLMGDLYLNFGWPGVVVGGVFFGYCVRFMYWRLIILDMKPFSLMAYIVGLEVASKMITSGISPQMVGVVWVVLAMWAIGLAFKVIRKI